MLFETWALNIGLPKFDIGLKLALNATLDKPVGLELALNAKLDKPVGLELASNAKLDKPVFDLRCSLDIFDLVLEFDIEFDVVFEFGIPCVGTEFG